MSGDAASVLAGVAPIRLLARERKEIWDEEEEYRKAQGQIAEIEKRRIRANAREALLMKWQDEWKASKKKLWSFALITKIKEWVKCEHGVLDYRLTQAFSGHGCFGTYLLERVHRPNSNCRFFGVEKDDVEHILFACPAHAQDEMKVKLTATMRVDVRLMGGN